MPPTVKTITSSADLGTKIDLSRLADLIGNAQFSTGTGKHSRSLVVRLRNPRTTAQVYSSGVIHVNGAVTEPDAKIAARKVARMIQKHGFDVGFKKYKIQTVIGYADLGYPLDVEELTTVHKQFASYEHELNPAVIYKMVEPRVVLNIFPSGKLMINGARSVEDMFKAFEVIHPILKAHRRVKKD